jgi:hypothetical protein
VAVNGEGLAGLCGLPKLQQLIHVVARKVSPMLIVYQEEDYVLMLQSRQKQLRLYMQCDASVEERRLTGL